MKIKYKIIKKAISTELAEFLTSYFFLKKKVLQTFLKSKYISPYNSEWGTLSDSQHSNTYCHFADMAMETLLERLKPQMEKIMGHSLLCTYSYARLYKKGDVLERHKDRFSCEISTTMFLGGDPWSIYLNPNPKQGVLKDGQYIHSGAKGIKVDLKQGDMLVYRGSDLEHWREEFPGENCCQVFLHYNKDTPKNKKNEYDGRPHLGLPQLFKDTKNGSK